MWYKGTVILCTRKDGYVLRFVGYGPEENKTIKSFGKAEERNEVKLL